jgi:hypothetical protein
MLFYYTPYRRLVREDVYIVLILTLSLDGVSGQRHARLRFSPGKGPPVPSGSEAGWAPEPVWTQRLRENTFPFAGDRTAIAGSYSP